jgi:hypothetical protein
LLPWMEEPHTANCTSRRDPRSDPLSPKVEPFIRT